MRQKIINLIFTIYLGQGGKVGVLGGSFEYTGAPYYAGISALKTVRIQIEILDVSILTIIIYNMFCLIKDEARDF